MTFTKITLVHDFQRKRTLRNIIDKFVFVRKGNMIFTGSKGGKQIPVVSLEP